MPAYEYHYVGDIKTSKCPTTGLLVKEYQLLRLPYNTKVTLNMRKAEKYCKDNGIKYHRGVTTTMPLDNIYNIIDGSKCKPRRKNARDIWFAKTFGL